MVYSSIWNDWNEPIWSNVYFCPGLGGRNTTRIYASSFWILFWVFSDCICAYANLLPTRFDKYIRVPRGEIWKRSYKIGAFYFLLSRTLGAAFRLFLVAIVLQKFIFDYYGIPFIITVALSIFLIWIYTHRGGIKTIIWTDTLQTFFMLLAVGLTVYFILHEMNWTFGSFFTSEVYQSMNKMIFVEDWKSPKYIWKEFLGGMFIAICMTGLDQDMMQKNLSCKNLKEAQKNMVSFASVLIVVNYIFLLLGVLLFAYATQNGIQVPSMEDGKPRTDLLYPEIALHGGMSVWLGIVFLLGLIAAAYSSADSALTSLTTSVSVDFLEIDTMEEGKQKHVRKNVHILMSCILLFVIVLFKYVLDNNVISEVLRVAGYTYGPLLGLFAFGICTKREIYDRLTPIVCLLSPLLTYFLQKNSEQWLLGYKFGLELLIVNGLITFLGLLCIVKKKPKYQVC